MIILAIWLFLGGVAAAQEGPLTCFDWSGWPPDWKHPFVAGWLEGTETADRLVTDTIMDRLWPTGHRVASVVVEIDVLCRRGENRKTRLGEVIQRIARDKNFMR